MLLDYVTLCSLSKLSPLRKSEVNVCLTIPIVHLQISKTIFCREHDFGRRLLRSSWINFDGNPFSFSIILLECFVTCLKEHVNMMYSQESERVNET